MEKFKTKEHSSKSPDIVWKLRKQVRGDRMGKCDHHLVTTETPRRMQEVAVLAFSLNASCVLGARAGTAPGGGARSLPQLRMPSAQPAASSGTRSSMVRQNFADFNCIDKFTCT